MLNLRQNFVILLFFFICASVIFLSFSASSKTDNPFSNIKKSNQNINSESYFKRADYYLVGLDRENFHLFSDELIHNQTTNEIILTKPNGVLFSKDETPIYYSSESGYFSATKNYLHLKDSVILRSKEAVINADQLVYDESRKKLDITGRVFSKTQNFDQFYEVRIKSNKMEYYPEMELANYSGNVDGKVERTRVYEQPVFFKSDFFKFSMLEKKATLSGNVAIDKLGVSATALRGEMFLENYNKKLKYFALYDDVIIKETVQVPGKPSFMRKAYSEKLEGYMSEGYYVLLGYPKVYQRDDVLKGNVIILRENNATIEVDDANTNFKLEQ